MSRDSAEKSRLGAYEVHMAREGFGSIRHVASGEIMHSRTPPMEEARRLYIEQSCLAARLQGEGSDAPLVIWDAGLGAAANAIAAILCYEEQAAAGPVRPLHIVSFENDLDPLRLALAQGAAFPYLRRPGPAAVLENGEWQSDPHPALRWTLLSGDFLRTMDAAPPPDIIFYDMFSPKTSASLWTLDAFRRLFDACAGQPVELFTYTCSTANRSALLAAGFHVAKGRRSGDKLETTIAMTPAARGSTRRHDLLDAAWLGKWTRSAARYPADIPEEAQPAFARLITGHPQFI